MHTKLSDFTLPYLIDKLAQVYRKVVIHGNSILKITPSGPNYVQVALFENGHYLSINYHQIIAFLLWRVTSGWVNEEFYVVSHLCHNVNCIGNTNEGFHYSYEPQGVNLSRQKCVRQKLNNPEYVCRGHIFRDNTYPSCIL